MGESEAVLRRWVECWRAYDDDGLAALCTEDAELYLPRNEIEGGGYRGGDGARRALADIRDSWDRIDYRLDDVEELGPTAIGRIRTTNVGKGGGPLVSFDMWIVLRVHDGLVAYSKPHLDEDAARADAER